MRFYLLKIIKLQFLKNKWVFPGKVKKVTVRPKKFDYKHTITHFEIYVQIQKKHVSPQVKGLEKAYMPLKNISRQIPFSLIQKTLKRI